ncbi:MAG TPA: hypothetical protein VG226_10670, partial [Acidimicrobiales bacterium]|nr:hypothetical protein [Acidimicrobiales bacterium]
EAPEDEAPEPFFDRLVERAVSRAAGPRLSFRLLRWSIAAIHESSQEGVSLTQEEQAANKMDSATARMAGTASIAC